MNSPGMILCLCFVRTKSLQHTFCILPIGTVNCVAHSWLRYDLRENPGGDVKFISKWVYEGAPDTYWLSCFFFPQGFMTAALQTYARKTRTAIDTLKFKTCVRAYGPDDIQEVPEDGVNIHGLFLEGARWDDGREVLEDSEPRKPVVHFPVIDLEPVLMDQDVEVGCYECPM